MLDVVMRSCPRVLAVNFMKSYLLSSHSKEIFAFLKMGVICID